MIDKFSFTVKPSFTTPALSTVVPPRSDGLDMRQAKTRSLSARLTMLGIIIAVTFGASATFAADCPGNPDALGTSRTIVIDPKEHPRIGTMQYGETLPLEDHEVVLTFDDGPLPAHTNAVLDILATQCVKATFFMVGRMAKEFPQGRSSRPRRRTYHRHTQREPSAVLRQIAAGAHGRRNR